MAKPNFKKSKGMQHLSQIAQKSNENVNTQQIVNIDISKISFNPRNEETFGMNPEEIETLAEDIKKNGFVGCIEIFKKENSEEYEIQAGHKRYMANSLAGNKTIPSVIVKKNRRRFISDNTNQRNFTFLQTARCILEWEEVLREEGFKGDMREEVARQMHMSPSQVYKYKSILNLIPPLQELLQEEKIPFSSSSAIAGIKSEEKQTEIYDKFVQYMNEHEQDSVGREVADKIIRNVKNGAKEEQREEPMDAEANREEIVIMEDTNEEQSQEKKNFNPVKQDVIPEEIGHSDIEPSQEGMNPEEIVDTPIELNQEEVNVIPVEQNQGEIKVTPAEQLDVVQMNQKELKPCPFCGGKAQLRQLASEENFYEVLCSICGCRTDGNSKCRISNTAIENQEINILAWNSRIGH